MVHAFITHGRLQLTTFCILIAAALAGCSDYSATPLPTLLPTGYIPTVVAMTLEAQGVDLFPKPLPTSSPTGQPSPTPIRQPTNTSSPVPTQTQPTLEPEVTPSPIPEAVDLIIPGDIPESINQILKPGDGSQVLSPFPMRVAVKPDDNSVVRFELLGVDGQLLMRDVRTFETLDPDWITMGSEISFGINSAAEPGRLLVSIEDEHGRLKSVTSIDLVLLTEGDQELSPPDDKMENIVIEAPQVNLLIQDGTMRVMGKARLRVSNPLRIQIVTSDGKIVGTRQVAVNPVEGSQYGTFAIDVPYSISSTNRVRVQVWEPGSHIPGIISLSSVEVLLSP
jgi:hypothetical protein